jgi:hypothetical protein
MKKQFQGSKKKARKLAYENRQLKKFMEKQKRQHLQDAIDSGNIEEMASAMGVKLL